MTAPCSREEKSGFAESASSDMRGALARDGVENRYHRVNG
jgi:hypothetical protein